jgi:hypothetical protein
MRQGTDQGDLVGVVGQARQLIAEADAGHGGADRLEAVFPSPLPELAKGV